MQAPDGKPSWLLSHLGTEFVLLCFGVASTELPRDLPLRPRIVVIGDGDGTLRDTKGLAASRYDAQPGTVYLIRPDQHVAARTRAFDADWLARALDRALALG
jgi:3-(3-hydroxy-phenyl)propionate hydroxylase